MRSRRIDAETCEKLFKKSVQRTKDHDLKYIEFLNYIYLNKCFKHIQKEVRKGRDVIHVLPSYALTKIVTHFLDGQYSFRKMYDSAYEELTNQYGYEVHCGFCSFMIVLCTKEDGWNEW